MSVFDERVVSMRFDNSKFNSNIDESIEAIVLLKKELEDNNINNGLDKIDFGKLASNVEDIKNRFTTFGEIAHAVIHNLVNDFMDLGGKILDLPVINQLGPGFDEYNLKMNSVQTIMAATGEELGVVSNYLEELNLYADKTIYSFSDMTENIGKFSNAGLSLDTSVASIQGIANWAAVSGANANEASRAMYNLAQSLGMGGVQYIDWKSVVLANMATEEFKQTAIETAVALGALSEYEVNGTPTNFFFQGKDEIAWFSNDVLAQTLSLYSTDVREMTEAQVEAYKEQLVAIGYTEEQAEKYVKLSKKAFDAATKIKTFGQLVDTLNESAGSGWGRTFEILLGDFEQARDMFTSVGDELGGIIDYFSNSRNDFLQQVFGNDSAHSFKNFLTEAGTSLEDFENSFRKVAETTGNTDLLNFLNSDDYTSIDSLEDLLKSGIVSAEVLDAVLEDLTQTSRSSIEELTGWMNEETVFLDGLYEYGNKLDEMYNNSEKFYNQVKSGNFSEFKSVLNGLEISTDDFVDSLAMVAVESKNSGLKKLIQEGKSFEAIMGSGKVSFEEFAEAISIFSSYNNEDILNSEEYIAGLQSEIDRLGNSSEAIDEVRGSVDAIADSFLVLSGREKVIESIKNVFIFLKNILITVSEAFQSVFPPLTVEQASSFLDVIYKMTGKLKLSDEALSRLRSGLEIFFKVIKSIIFPLDVIKSLIVNMLPFMQILFSLLGVALGALAKKFLEVTDKVKTFFKENENVKNFFDSLSKKIEALKTSFSDLVTKIKTKISTATWERFDSILGTIGSVLLSIGSAVIFLGNKILTIGDYAGAVFGFFGEILEAAKPDILKFTEVFKESFTKNVISKVELLPDLISDSFKKVKKFINRLFGKKEEDEFDLSKNLLGSTKEVKNEMSWFQEQLSFFDQMNPGAAFYSNLKRNIIDKLTLFAKSFEGKFNSVKNFFGGLFGNEEDEEIYDFDMPKNLLGSLDPSSALSSSGSSFSEILKRKRDEAKEVIKKFSEVFSLSKEKDSSSLLPMDGLDSGENALGSFFQSMLEKLKKFKGEFDLFWANFKISTLDPIKKNLKEYLTSFKMEDLSLTNIFKTLGSGSVVAGLININRLTSSLSDFIDTLKKDDGEEQGLLGTLKKIKDLFGKKEEKQEGFLGEIKEALSGLKDESVKTLKELEGTLGAFQTNLKSEALLKIALAVGVIAVAMLVIARVDSTQVDKALGIMAGSLIALMGALQLMTNSQILGPKKMNDISTALLKTAFAMLIMSFAIKSFAGAIDKLSKIPMDRLIKGLVSFTAILAIVAGFSKVVDANRLAASSGAMIALAFAMNLFAGALVTMGLNPHVTKSIVQMVAVFGIIASFVKELNSKDAVKLRELGFGMILFGAALDLISVAFLLLGINPGIKKGIVTLAAITAAAMLMSRFVKPSAMIQISLSFMIFSAALIVASAALVAMGIAMPIFSAGVLAMTAMLGPKLGEVAKVLIAISAATLAASVMFAAAGVLLIPFALSITLVGAALGLLGVALGVVAAGITLIAAAIVAINIARVTSSLASFIATLENIGSNSLLAKIPKIISAVLVGALEGFTTFITGSLEVIANMFGDLLDIVKSIDDDVMEFIAALVDMGVKLIVGLASSLLENADTLVDSFFNLFMKVCDLLIKYLPQITAKIVDLLVMAFDSLNEHIPRLLASFNNFLVTLFGEMAKDGSGANIKAMFIDMLKGLGAIELFLISLSIIGPMIAPGYVFLIQFGLFVAELAVVLAALGQLNKIPGLAEFISSGGDLLQNIGEALGKFVGGLIGGALEGVFASLPQLGIYLSQFMINLQPFIFGLKGIDSGSMEALGSLTTGLLKITGANLLNNIGKWLGFGDSVTDFGKQLAKLGPSFAAFARSVSGIDNEAVVASVSSIETMIGVVNSLPSEGGWLQKITGEKSLTSFATGLVALAPSLVSYANIVKDLDQSVIEKSVIPVNMLSEMAKNVPDVSGILSFFSGDSELNRFALGIQTLGPAMLTYSENVSQVDSGIVAKSVAVASALSSLVTGLPDISALDLLFGTDNATKFGTQIVNLGKKLNEFYISISSIDTELMTTVITSIQSITDLANMEIDWASLQDAFSLAITDLLASGFRSINDTATEYEPQITAKIESTIKGALVNAGTVVNREMTVVDMKFRSKLSSLISTIKTYEEGFRQAGYNLARGLANGISNGQALAVNAATLMGQSALDAAKRILRINSPSKAFEEIGSYTGEGFVIGLNEWASKSVSTAENLGEGAKSGLAKIMGTINDFLQNGIETNPVIRPVLDLTEVNKDFESLNASFSRGQAISVASNAHTGPLSGSISNQSVDNTKNYGGFTFNIYTESSDPDEIARKIGLEVNRRLRFSSTI